MFVDCRQKVSADESKQTNTFLEIPNSNESSVEMHKSSFEHLLTYLSLSIKWAPGNVARALKCLFPLAVALMNSEPVMEFAV